MKENQFQIAIIGLGLMGGSLAFALRGFKDCKITAYDPDGTVIEAALSRRAIDSAAQSLEEAVKHADIAVFCSNPASIIENMSLCMPFFKDKALVTDICGVKEEMLDFASRNLTSLVNYIGMHPMAGKEVGGFSNADPAIYKNAGFILVPPEDYNENALALMRELCEYAGAGRVVVNNARDHDRIIAYSSDLMHISATALCADYPEDLTMAHTAGAFRDSTRVANIDASLWTELLSDNAENILPQLQRYIDSLIGFKQAMERGDKAYIRDFLQNACDNKKKILTL